MRTGTVVAGSPDVRAGQRSGTNRVGRLFCFASGALSAMLLAGCGVTTTPQPVPAVPRQALGLRPAPAGVAESMTKAAPDLRFGFNSHILDARQRRKLAQIAPALEELLYDIPDLVIVIEGHADDYGLVGYNDRLALERAEAVRRYLQNLSFPKDRLRAVSFGHSAPEHATRDDANRRVHFRAAVEMPPPR